MVSTNRGVAVLGKPSRGGWVQAGWGHKSAYVRPLRWLPLLLAAAAGQQLTMELLHLPRLHCLDVLRMGPGTDLRIEGAQECLGLDLGFCLLQDGQATKGGLRRVCALSQRDSSQA